MPPPAPIMPPPPLPPSIMPGPEWTLPPPNEDGPGGRCPQLLQVRLTLCPQLLQSLLGGRAGRIVVALPLPRRHVTFVLLHHFHHLPSRLPATRATQHCAGADGEVSRGTSAVARSRRPVTARPAPRRTAGLDLAPPGSPRPSALSRLPPELPIGPQPSRPLTPAVPVAHRGLPSRGQSTRPLIGPVLAGCLLGSTDWEDW